MPIAICPGCDEDVRISGRPTIGMLVTCEQCLSQFEVVSIDPLELDWAFSETEEELEEDEDWDDE